MKKIIEENIEPKELNKLIIIGNGFDLAHGLKTSYHDFMLWILSCEFKKHFDGLITFDIVDFSNAPKREGTEVFNNYSLSDFQVFFFDKNPNYKSLLEETHGIMNTEILMQYFSALNRNKIGIKNNIFRHLLFHQKINYWVDIENEFYKTLVKFYKNDVNLKEFKSLEEFNSDFEQIKQLLEQYLISIKDKSVSSKSKISTFFKDLPKFNKTKTIHPVFICNFNYTDTLNSYIRKDTDLINDDICFIHGEIDRPQNPIVFGFGDEKEENYLPMESSKDDRYLKFIKSFAYLKTPYYSKLLSFIEAEPFEVVIMGHSCGQSDRVLLKTIFEHDNCQKIIIKYYERPDGTDDFDEKAKEIARSFTDKALFRKRVVHYQDERVTSLS